MGLCPKLKNMRRPRERGNFSKEECARGRAYLTRHDVADLLVVGDVRDRDHALFDDLTS